MEITPAITQRIWNEEFVDLEDLLDKAEADANGKFERWPEEKLSRWRGIGWTLWALSLAAFAVAIHRIVSQMAPKLKPGEHRKPMTWRSWMIFLPVIPAVAFVLLWSYYPLLRGSVMAFQDYKITGESRWLGIDNFVILFGNADFYWSLLRTFITSD